MGEQDWLDKDFYKILGVKKDADDKEIRKAYRKLARKWHPDQNKGDAKAEAKFKEIGEAFSVLNDKEQRERYDAIRAMGAGGPRFAPGQGGGFEDLFGGAFGGGGPGGPNVRFQSSGGGFGGGGGGFEDILSGLFGGGGGAQSFSGGGGGFPGGAGGYGGGGFAPQPQRGSDLSTSTKLTFKNAFEGETLTFNLDGRSLRVRIPAGVKDGQKIKLKGKGQPGVNGGPAGDLIVEVAVEKHPVFSVEGGKLRVQVPISYPEAALGARIDVPLPDGSTVGVRVPAGTSSGALLRVREKGIKKGNKRGDAIVELKIVTPSKLTDAERKAVEDLKEAEGTWDPRADLKAKAAAER